MSDILSKKIPFELFNQAVTEDAEDMAVFAERAPEPNLPFEDVLKDLRLRGKI